jgi:hypothetical protein
MRKSTDGSIDSMENSKRELKSKWPGSWGPKWSRLYSKEVKLDAIVIERIQAFVNPGNVLIDDGKSRLHGIFTGKRGNEVSHLGKAVIHHSHVVRRAFT